MAERQQPTHSDAQYSVTVGAVCEMPGVDETEAWRRAGEIEQKIANVLAEYGVSNKPPLVNVWSTGGGPILD